MPGMSELPADLYTAAQVRALDGIAAEALGIGGRELMERAGAAALATLRRRWPRARRLVVVAGPGNNGGDGYVLARRAGESGLAVEVVQLGDAGRIAGDALAAREAYVAVGGAVSAFAGALPKADVLVDALFGIGLQRALDGPWKAAMEAVNASGCPVLALDIPSGLHADTGAVLGVAVKAVLTVTFIGLKQGLLTGEAADHVGELQFEDLGVPAAVYARARPAGRRLTLSGALAALGRRGRADHKGRFGHVLVIGGELGMPGAVRLAAEAAARVGAGLVTVATRPEHVSAVVAMRPELMCAGVTGPDDLEPLLSRATVVAVGPGLGRGAWGRSLLGRVLDTGLPLVVDADALSLLAGEPMAREDWVLTPHPGEAARLLGTTAAAVQADRFDAVRAIVGRYGGVCVLKGAGSLVADSLGTAVCTAGNPGMASGGMGDVLTGAIAGLRAQGLSGRAAAELGVCLHAQAADELAAEGERGLLAGDLLPVLRRLVNLPGA